MKMTELHQLIEHHPSVEVQIQSHHEGVYFTVEIILGDMTYCLHGQKGKPLVFRDEDSARNLLQQSGIKQVKSHRVLSRLSTLAQPLLNTGWRAQLA
ncbi:DUF6482 family protein [Oceanospirillum maris]|jgi:hypothetical protein|uniref:DUF6482 family protein n=1 Tax=Oceanospirillum maris TaxID=64977 RepID=UPI00042509AF|nr:DUF6482 family protein [Oceanospirillum maris]